MISLKTFEFSKAYMTVFMIGVPKRNDLYLKDYKGELRIFLNFTLL
jgi:hypothetical protein